MSTVGKFIMKTDLVGLQDIELCKLHYILILSNDGIPKKGAKC